MKTNKQTLRQRSIGLFQFKHRTAIFHRQAATLVSSQYTLNHSTFLAYPKGEEELVHWCHGSPGVIHLLIQAIVVFGDEYYLHVS